MFAKIVCMKKQFLFLLLFFFVSFISAQELKPLPDCKDMKEKIDSIRESLVKLSFEKLTEAFKGNLIEKDGNEMLYTSENKLCAENGTLAVIKDTYGWDFILKFEFNSRKYKASIEDFNSWGLKFLEPIKQVFDKWDLMEYPSAANNGNVPFYVFTEKVAAGSPIKRYVSLKKYVKGDNVSFELVFQRTQY
jgi:hypothetical protein